MTAGHRFDLACETDQKDIQSRKQLGSAEIFEGAYIMSEGSRGSPNINRPTT